MLYGSIKPREKNPVNFRGVIDHLLLSFCYIEACLQFTPFFFCWLSILYFVTIRDIANDRKHFDASFLTGCSLTRVIL